MERYELTYIINGDVTDDGVDEVAKRIDEYIKKNVGNLTIAKSENLGRRRLAYPIKKKINGIYVTVIFTGETDGIEKLNRELELDDAILRHIIIREEKKSEAQIAKQKTLRERVELSRAHRDEIERVEEMATSRQRLVQKPSELKKQDESSPETLEKLEEKLDEILKRDIVE